MRGKSINFSFPAHYNQRTAPPIPIIYDFDIIIIERGCTRHILKC